MPKNPSTIAIAAFVHVALLVSQVMAQTKEEIYDQLVTKLWEGLRAAETGQDRRAFLGNAFAAMAQDNRLVLMPRTVIDCSSPSQIEKTSQGALVITPDIRVPMVWHKGWVNHQRIEVDPLFFDKVLCPMIVPFCNGCTPKELSELKMDVFAGMILHEIVHAEQDAAENGPQRERAELRPNLHEILYFCWLLENDDDFKPHVLPSINWKRFIILKSYGFKRAFLEKAFNVSYPEKRLDRDA